jgi:hypothetical protein
MASFSFGGAIGAGLRVIGRHPLAVPVWAAVYIVFVALPAIAIVIHVLPDAIASIHEAAQRAGPGARPDPTRLMALRSQTFGWQPVIWLLQVITHTVVMGAVFRAVLEPQNSRWAFLRLSRQELWLGLTYLVIMVMGFIMALALAIPLAIASAVVAGVAQHGGGGSPVAAALLITLIGLAGAGAIVWALLRLSLALPMSFAQGKFPLYESWDLARGQAFKMVLVFLVLAIGVVLFEFVVVAVAGVTLIPHLKSAALSGDTGVEAAIRVIRQRTPLLVGLIVVISLVAMAIQAILIAPLAEIYRELTAKAEPVV